MVRKTTLALGFAGLLVLTGGQQAHATAITWIDGTGDWFTATNWEDPGAVNVIPSNTDDAFINNGGTAQIATANTLTHRVYAGATGAGGPTSGALSGTVTAANRNIGANFSVNAGVATDGVTSATGAITTTNGDIAVAGGSLNAGIVSDSTTAGQASATGTMTVDGAIDANIFNTIGAVISGDGDADGTVTASNGATGTFAVGVTLNAAATAQATGMLTVNGGDLNFRSGMFRVGDVFGDGTAVGTVDIQAGGLVTYNPLNTFEPDVIAGRAHGGSATGTMTAQFIDTTAKALGDVIVGQASNGGTAVGTFNPGTGDIDVAGDFLVGRVWLDVGGDATGNATVGGTVTGDGNFFEVGSGRGFGFFDAGLGTADGTMTADGIGGFDTTSIGYLAGKAQQATVSATGALDVGTGGLGGMADGTGRLNIGVVDGVPNNNQLDGPGGSATGMVTVTGGNVGPFGDGIYVGHSNHFGTADGTLMVTDGDVTTSGLLIGTTMVQNPGTIAAPDAVSHATGSFSMSNGTLTVNDSPFTGSLIIGQAISRGTAVGTAVLTDVDVIASDAFVIVGSGLFSDGPDPVSGTGTLDMTGGSLAARSLIVGRASDGDTGIGTVSFDSTMVDIGETLAVGAQAGQGMLTANASTINVGEDFSVQNFGSINDPGSGAVTLTDSQLNVTGSTIVGPTYQGGSGALSLIDSTMTVGEFMRVGQSSNFQTLFGDSDLLVDRSHIDVAGELRYDIGADVEFVIGGTGRGTDYGAIDAMNALLDGELIISFEFVPAALTDFDLIVTDLLDGIEGDFLSVSILGLAPGFGAVAGIVTDDLGDGLVEIYRVSVFEVPEPATFVLFLFGAVVLILYRRRAAGEMTATR